MQASKEEVVALDNQALCQQMALTLLKFRYLVMLRRIELIYLLIQYFIQKIRQKLQRMKEEGEDEEALTTMQW